jgi:hypothetical protein
MSKQYVSSRTLDGDEQTAEQAAWKTSHERFDEDKSEIWSKPKVLA